MTTDTAPPTPALAYHDATEALAGDTERRVLAIAEVTLSAVMIAAVIARANAAAVGLADLGVAVQIEAATGTPTPTLGIVASDDTERLTRAVATITDRAADTTMQLSRLARSEPLGAAQRATTVVIAGHPRVSGWVRQPNAGACALCRWWARGGHVYPVDHPFQSHPGCNCAARIILTDKEFHYVR